MAKMRYRLLTAAAVSFTACTVELLRNGAHAADATPKTAAAASTEAALETLEKSAYEAWQSRDVRFWDKFLSDKFIGWGASGRLEKLSATKEYSAADCEVKSYALASEQTRPLGQDAALITHQTTVDGSCGGQKLSAESWAASVYVRDKDTWKGAFHAEAPIVNPASVKPISQKDLSNEGHSKPLGQDAPTIAMLALERELWEAWREHDAKKIADLTAEDITFINIFGTYLANKANALKDWSGTGCDVKSIGITAANATVLSPTVRILTFKAIADGACYGQKVGPVWGSSVYVKHGDKWKWTFGINLPAPPAST
jgi:ketosteroid isomerase-like protein